MNKLLFILLFQIGFAQKPTIAVTITDIKTENLNSGEVEYTIAYNVKNNLDHHLKFFFNPDDFGLSMSTRKIFMLYENGVRYDGDRFLKTGTKKEFTALQDLYNAGKYDTISLKKRIDLIQKLYDFDIKTANQGFSKEAVVKKSSERYANDVVSLEPNETRSYIQKMYWHKNRYYQNGDLEYYLNEESTFEISFALILMKKQLQEQLTEGFYSEIMQDKNFIEGVFQSNKMVVHFKE